MRAAACRGERREWLAWAVAAVVLVVALATFAVQQWLLPAPQVIHGTITTPEKMTLDIAGDFSGPAMLSPDGEQVVFVAHGPDSPRALWMHF